MTARLKFMQTNFRQKCGSTICR